MNMSERIKLIRKDLNLSQELFGKKLGVTKTTISRLEKGINNVTEQMIISICREFNINEDWLRNGTGEMLKPTTNDKLKQLSLEYNLNKLEETFFSSYLNLDSKRREAVCDFLEDVFSKSLSTFSNINEESFEYNKNKELNSYSLELDAEQKGGMSQALGKLEGA